MNTRLLINKLVRFVSTLDIGNNPEPAAIFDPLIQGFNVWAIPSDHPGGDWNKIVDKMDAGAFSKRCSYVGTAFYDWQKHCVEISTDAYALRDNLREYRHPQTIHNRPDDIAWLKEKVIWVFEQIDEECPPIVVSEHDL